MTSTNQLLAVKSGKDLNAIMPLRVRLECETTAEVRFDAATRAIYASEASNYRQPPLVLLCHIIGCALYCRTGRVPSLHEP